MAIGHPSELADTLPDLELLEDMVSTYPVAREYIQDVFPAEDNEGIQYPPDTPEDFQRNFEASPSFQQAFAQELWTLLNEIEADGFQYNGKELYDHQLAHLWYIASSIAGGKKSPKSFFIEGAPGTGKTLTLGVLMLVAIRMQIRGAVTGKIAYATAKPYHLASKVRGKGNDKARVLRAPPYDMTEKDFRRIRTKLSKKDTIDTGATSSDKANDSELMQYYFPKKAWDELFRLQGLPVEEIQEAILDSLRKRELYEDFQTELPRVRSHFLRTLTLIIAGRAALVPGPHKTVELLELPRPPESDTDQLEAHTGDAGSAIPVGYPVFSRESTGLSVVEREDARVILEPANIFTSATQIERYGHVIHRDIQVLFCDEAQRRHPLVFQNPVIESGGREKPVVFAAGSQWYGKDYDRQTPRHSMLESIRRGVLPNFGVRIFPSASDIHFPSETQESFEQMIDVYFKNLRVLKELHLDQPYESNTLIVVHGKLIDATIMRLREEYAGRNIPTPEIHPYTGSDEEKESLAVWFDDMEKAKGPHILVATPTMIKESIDLQTLRHLVVGTKVSADVLYGLVGRLAHGRDIQSDADRMLLTMQQFENSNLRATPFVSFNHEQDIPEEEFLWVPGHALMNEDAYENDEEQLSGKEKRYQATTVPKTAQRKRGDSYPIVVEGGHSMIPDKGYVSPHPTRSSQKVSAALHARIPMAPSSVDYSLEQGTPSREIVTAWAEEFDGAYFASKYSTVFLAAERAYQSNEDPRMAVRKKIAELREKEQNRAANNGVH